MDPFIPSRVLPTHFGGHPIRFRVPYTMPGEIIVQNGATGVPFPEATFLHAVDKPFEIHRMIARLTPFDNQATPVQLSPAVSVVQAQLLDYILEHYIRIRVRDTSKNENMTKNAQLLATLWGAHDRVWEWEDPYTIVRSEGLEVTVDNVATANFLVGEVTINNIRVAISFIGFLIVVAPPSETR